MMDEMEVESCCLTCPWHCLCRNPSFSKSHLSSSNVFDFSKKNLPSPLTTTAVKITSDNNLSANNSHGVNVSDGTTEELGNDEDVVVLEERVDAYLSEEEPNHKVASVWEIGEVNQPSRNNKVFIRRGKLTGRRYLSAFTNRRAGAQTKTAARFVANVKATAADYDSKSLVNGSTDIKSTISTNHTDSGAQFNSPDNLKSEQASATQTAVSNDESHLKTEDLVTPTVITNPKPPPSSAPAAVNAYGVRVRNRSSFYKCTSCCKMFGQLSSLKRHEKEHLLESTKHCECLECGKSYTSLSSYQRHLKTHTKCQICGKTISKASMKQPHYLTNVLAVNVCQKCRNADSNYKTPNKRGAAIVIGTTKTQVMMTVSEITNGNIEQVMEPHVKEYDEDPSHGYEKEQSTVTEERKDVAIKGFKCDICSQTFELIRQLKLHYIMHMQSMSAYPSKYCEEVFAETKERAKHEAEIHPSSKRPHKCLKCPATFKALPHLIRHKYSHTGDKPFKCNHCGQRFNQRFILTRHLASVHDVHVEC